LIKYNPNELQKAVLKRELKKINEERRALEHETLRYSMKGKANDEILHDLLETKVNETKYLTTDQINHIQANFNANSQSLQWLNYQNTRNKLLTNGHETAIKLAHISTANGALENDILTQLNNVATHINYLENQLQNLKQQNTQLAGQHNEFRIISLQQQANLEVQITQLQIEKQNIENLIQQMRQ
jgi:hypothetical protein